MGLGRFKAPALGAAGILLIVGIAGAVSDAGKGSTVAQMAQMAPTPAPVEPGAPLVLTEYFYWYDATTRGHLQEQSLRYHPPRTPVPDWRSIAWHKKELSDMADAGIDVVLPVSWGAGGPEDRWSTEALPALATAWQELRAGGTNPPRIGMFLDTTIVQWRDLTTQDGKQWFYGNFREFFSRIPRDAWSQVDGGPVIFLFTSDWTTAVDQSTFDYVYQAFNADFGVKPYIVREVSWDYPILRWERSERVRDFRNPIRTDNSYLWAGSIHGFIDRGGVAAVGPGYDDRHIPDRRGGRVTERRDGAYYVEEFRKAIAARKQMLVIETWNEFHEGSGISETLEFGRQYIDLTRQLTREYRDAVGPN